VLKVVRYQALTSLQAASAVRRTLEASSAALKHQQVVRLRLKHQQVVRLRRQQAELHPRQPLDINSE
jgi:hypothetical protein